MVDQPDGGLRNDTLPHAKQSLDGEVNLEQPSDMRLPNLIRRSNSAERATASATVGSPASAPRRLSRRSHSTGSLGSLPGQDEPDSRNDGGSLPGSPAMVRRSVELARRFSRGRSMDRSLHGEEQQEDDSATRHEEDSVVSGHTIHSFQLSPQLIAPMPRQSLVSAPMSRQLPPVSRQPTPVIMGDRLTGDRLTSASSASRLPAAESSPPQTRPQVPMSPVDHTAVRLTVGDREDEIEAEISSSMSAWAGSLTTLAAPADAPAHRRGRPSTRTRSGGQPANSTKTSLTR